MSFDLNHNAVGLDEAHQIFSDREFNSKIANLIINLLASERRLLELKSKREAVLSSLQRHSSHFATGDFLRKDYCNDGSVRVDLAQKTVSNDFGRMQTQSDFQARLEISRRCNSAGAALTAYYFLRGASHALHLQLEEIESEIDSLLVDMRRLETKISDTPPETLKEALLKLKFIAGLFVEGTEMSVDYFAYLIVECIFILELRLGSL